MTVFTLIEDGDMEVWWECSACGELNKPTKAIEKDRKCRHCGAIADELVDELNE